MAKLIQDPWINPYVKRFGETPITIVKDLNTNLKVELRQGPEVTGTLREFVECGPMSSPPDYKDSGTSLTELIDSQALWQGLETLHFTFLVTGCTRLLTHQLVRQRIGITFSQQCSDSVDWRHHNIMLPRHVPLVDATSAISAKLSYARLIDSRMCSCQDARYKLEQCLEVFLYIHLSLATLIDMIRKRCCTMSQPWETYLWAFRTKEEVLKTYPELIGAFQSACAVGKCFYHKSKENPRSAYLYQPDEEHGCDTFSWNPESYIYPNTHREMSDFGTPHETQYFVGLKKVCYADYAAFAERYKV